MPVDPEAVKERWDRIRKNKECDLALTPESVAKYLATPESKLVRRRISESLSQFAQYRIEMRDKGFVSREPDAPGEMATCEGLEAFLVPAVEKALPFSKFLEEFDKEDREKKQRFVATVKRDVRGLLEGWKEGRFSGQPYANTDKIFDAILPTLQSQFKPINITEAAAMACRVLIHLLTLKLNRPEEKLFQQEIGKELDDNQLSTALCHAIEFLIRAFQKGDGESEEARIANATFAKDPGSGWSWTDHPGLPPMLFFTAAAVDAFAELDLYLIRPVVNNELANSINGQKIAEIYNNNKEKLLQLQLCVEMARRWVQKAVLPNLSVGYGQHVERFPKGNDPLARELEYDLIPKDYEDYETGIKRLKLASPVVFYNSLYALLILLWSWGDWDDKGEDYDDEATSRINRALAQLIYNYTSIPGVKEILNRVRYVFYLPGKGIFQPQPRKEDKCSYMDSAFLPLLTRLLVLFVVYGVADRNLLEPVIRDLYVELLQNQNRKKLEHSALWSSEGVEVFATQRAIQALTFYYAYARGKEIVERRGGGDDLITLRTKTRIPVILEVVAGHAAEPSEVPATGQAPGTREVPRPPLITAEKFSDYCRELPGWRILPTATNKGEEIQNDAKKLGETILSDFRAGKINDAGAAKLILDSLANIFRTPEQDGRDRASDIKLLEEMYEFSRITTLLSDPPLT